MRATWPRSSSRARLISTSISARAASSWLLRAASPSALPCSTIPVARELACSTMPRAWSRAAAMILSTSTLAVLSEFLPCSAAARPLAISVSRCSMAPMISGHTYFMQNQTNTIIAIDCPINVALKSTQALLWFPSNTRAGGCGAGRCARARTHASADARRDEREVQRDTEADDRDRVEQADDEEHLCAQHRRELGLTRGTLEEAPAEEPHSDRHAQPAEADQEANGEQRHSSNKFHQSLLSKKIRTVRTLVRLAFVVRLIQIHDRQHHEYVGLQCDHKNVEHGPAEMQRQLIPAEQRDQDENQLARVHVAPQPQRQRHGPREERRALEHEVESDDARCGEQADSARRRRERVQRELLEEAQRALDLQRVIDGQHEHRQRHCERDIDVGRRHDLEVRHMRVSADPR